MRQEGSIFWEILGCGGSGERDSGPSLRETKGKANRVRKARKGRIRRNGNHLLRGATAKGGKEEKSSTRAGMATFPSKGRMWLLLFLL